MNRSITRLKFRLKEQMELISGGSLKIPDQLVLTRSLLENYSTFNFLIEKDSRKRLELFKCYGDFEWYSHTIFRYASDQRSAVALRLLKRTAKKYPYGFNKYYRLIKRRLCKFLIKSHQLTRLNLINSDKVVMRPKQLKLVAKYMAHHLITKLPFPYRIVFGKSITNFVLKYSHLDRDTYWLLADLSHGTLLFSHLDPKFLLQIIQKVLRIIKKNLRNC